MLIKALYKNGITLSIKNHNNFELDSVMFLYMNTFRDLISAINTITNDKIVSLIKFTIMDTKGVHISYSQTRRVNIRIGINNLKEITNIDKIELSTINKYFTNILDTLFSIISKSRCSNIISSDINDDSEYMLKIESCIDEINSTAFIMGTNLFDMIYNFNKCVMSYDELLNQKLKN
jgi:hypothetical protein